MKERHRDTVSLLSRNSVLDIRFTALVLFGAEVSATALQRARDTSMHGLSPYRCHANAFTSSMYLARVAFPGRVTMPQTKKESPSLFFLASPLTKYPQHSKRRTPSTRREGCHPMTAAAVRTVPGCLQLRRDSDERRREGRRRGCRTGLVSRLAGLLPAKHVPSARRSRMIAEPVDTIAATFRAEELVFAV